MSGPSQYRHSAVTVLLPAQLPTVVKGDEALPVRSGMPLELTVNDVFS